MLKTTVLVFCSLVFGAGFGWLISIPPFILPAENIVPALRPVLESIDRALPNEALSDFTLMGIMLVVLSFPCVAALAAIAGFSLCYLKPRCFIYASVAPPLVFLLASKTVWGLGLNAGAIFINYAMALSIALGVMHLTKSGRNRKVKNHA